MLGFIFNALTRKRAALETKLLGVSGFTGRGDIAFGAWKNGKKKMKVALRGVAGKTAEIYANNTPALTLSVNNGRVKQNFTTLNGDNIPDLIEGTHIDIRQNGEVILAGVLKSD